ncbi:winged helix-turn-helix domain-containing protein, partial [Morganella morganii]|uniref:winged helix-turn-helix domain-containing protein n=1 Tax=Morganella morganii TaxID=582 RepID=UPI0019668ABE
MKKIYINNKILYIPNQNLLRNLLFPNRETVLNEPSARCLDALLLSNDDFVPHKDLYEKGWSGIGKEPSPNTLYQNILLLRKGLKEISDDNVSYIITIPRKGFYFNKDIKIQYTDKDTDTDTDTDKDKDK